MRRKGGGKMSRGEGSCHVGGEMGGELREKRDGGNREGDQLERREEEG